MRPEKPSSPPQPATAEQLPLLRIVCTALLAVVIGLIVFWPNPGDIGQESGLSAWLRDFHAAGGPGWITLARIEFTANIVMFFPVGAVAWWWKASIVRNTLFGFAATIFIEVTQAVAVPGRVSDFRDIIANTLGALIASCCCALVEHAWKRRMAPR
ncbi:MAG: VanZ family protein [Galactobacter sp.]